MRTQGDQGVFRYLQALKISHLESANSRQLCSCRGDAAQSVDVTKSQ